ncbi:hypothetical protein ACFVW1_20770 [Streptomyces olivochromogenes]|uniref:hypothetical protein n=1 Tax=Streptomyces olivochromogenes TaxID=1963 RepID=UPI0036DF8A1C
MILDKVLTRYPADWPTHRGKTQPNVVSKPHNCAPPTLTHLNTEPVLGHELAVMGLSLRAVGCRLQLDRKAVRRCRHSDLEPVLVPALGRGAGVLDPFTDDVQHRFQAVAGPVRRPPERLAARPPAPSTTPPLGQRLSAN